MIPNCPTCPVSALCLAIRTGNPAQLPIKTKRVKVRDEHRFALYITNEESKVLIAQRPEDGLLGGLWDLPLVPVEGEGSLQPPRLPHLVGVSQVPPIKHVFSHIRMTVTPLVLHAEPGLDTMFEGYDVIRWVTLEELGALPTSTLMRKVYAALGLAVAHTPRWETDHGSVAGS